MIMSNVNFEAMKKKILEILEEGKVCGYNNEAIANEPLNLHSVSNCLSFKEQMNQDLIPRVWKMVEKEKEHLGWLIDNDAPTEMINMSSSPLSHLRQRHKEYNDYVANLN